MASNTKNVQLGVCKIFFGGVDLGYTQGGVDVTVKTDTHKVNVDQFGKTPINEYIMGREVMVKAPLAETTLENLVKIMPGSTMVATGQMFATTGSMTVGGTPVTTDSLSVTYSEPGAYGSTVVTQAFTFKTVPIGDYDVAIGATLAASLVNLAAVINQSTAPINAVVTATTLTISADDDGVDGNNITLAKTMTGMTITSLVSPLAGGAEPTSAYVSVPTGIGQSLLNYAQKLVLHPIANAATDQSQDFTVYQAATAGALSFAYKLENERIYNCDFNGYPDPVTGALFAVGDLGVVVL